MRAAVLNRVVSDEENTDKDKAWEIWGRLPAITKERMVSPEPLGDGGRSLWVSTHCLGIFTKGDEESSSQAPGTPVWKEENETSQNWQGAGCGPSAGAWQIGRGGEVELGQLRNALHTRLGSLAYRKPRWDPGSDLVNFMEDSSGNLTDGVKSSSPKSPPGL